MGAEKGTGRCKTPHVIRVAGLVWVFGGHLTTWHRPVVAAREMTAAAAPPAQVLKHGYVDAYKRATDASV